MLFLLIKSLGKAKVNIHIFRKLRINYFSNHCCYQLSNNYANYGQQEMEDMYHISCVYTIRLPVLLVRYITPQKHGTCKVGVNTL